MRLTFGRIARNEALRLARDEGGVAVVFTLGAFLFLYVVCMGVVSIGAQVREKAQLQDACDAAAYSAAVVQADGLSRMAVVNRAMAWSYVQMTKMQMDYITLRWLELTKQRFEEDDYCTSRTKLVRMFSKEAGYHCFESDWKKLGFLAWWSENIGYTLFPYVPWIRFGFSCKHDIHNKASNPNAAYIGFKRPGENGSSAHDYRQVRHIRLNHPTRDTKSVLYLPKSSGDRVDSDRYGGNPTPSLDEITASLRSAYGSKGANLAPRIDAMRNAIVSCNALLPAINAKMAESMRETAVRTLREHLPRTPEGVIDEDLLSDYSWTVAGGVSTPPIQYSAGLTNRIENTSYFSGLRNVEEDEMLFLNMADGLPEATGGNKVVSRNRKDVRLVDYFADGDLATGKGTVDSTAGVAAGLDQWFIRCDPSEPGISNQKSIIRSFAGGEGGIVRGYKNANYYEGQSGGSLLGHALDVGEGIHRANYVFDGVQDWSDTAKWTVGNAKDQFMNGIFKNYIKSQLNDAPSKHVHPKKPKHRWQIGKYLKYRAQKALKKGLKEKLDPAWENLTATLDKHIFGPLETVLEHFIEGLGDLDPEPSCNNSRERFIDKCANVRDTTGLVSEYEWASAYWFCFWYDSYTWGGHYKGEYHVPAPMAAIHGGVKRKKSRSPSTTYGDTSSIRTDSYAHGLFCPWYHEEMREFRGRPKGKSRDDYHSSFISIDADIPENCSHGGVMGKRSNFILKGFVRIYGDDGAIYDPARYVGVPAQPWVLNDRFFNGGGSIVVGLSKRQRNVFERLAESIAPPGLHSAYSPPPARGSLNDAPDDPDLNRRFVVFSAARAGFAPRTGEGTVGAGGRDTVNVGGASAPRRYELRWDSVTDRSLGRNRHPSLPDTGGLGSYRDYLEREGRIGCVCGEPNTTERLRHQWNLCQVDWDGMLIPLREAHARHTGYDSAAVSFGGAGRDALSEWDFFQDAGDLDSVNATVGSLLYGNAVWRSFDASDDATLPTSQVMPLPDEDGTPVDLFRLRRLL